MNQPIGGWPPDRPGLTLLGRPIELLSPDLVRTVDSIELPPPDRPVEGRSSREDSYTIHVTTSLEATVERLVELIGDRSVAILTDSTVMDLYGPTVVRALERYSIHPEVGVVPAGERHKTLSRAFELLDWLTGTQIGRGDVIVNLGGGVVIDMGGWVASSYMRGVAYINVPTTLVGQVDAAIGGCRSRRSGIRCVNTRNGHGFALSREHVRRF